MPKSNDGQVPAWCEEVKRRQSQGRPPRRIGEVLSQLLVRQGYAQSQMSAELQTQWRQAVGEPMARHSRPGTIGRGVLQVVVRNSSVLQELTFRKRELLARMREFGQTKLRDLRFRVGEID